MAGVSWESKGDVHVLEEFSRAQRQLVKGREIKVRVESTKGKQIRVCG